MKVKDVSQKLTRLQVCNPVKSSCQECPIICKQFTSHRDIPKSHNLHTSYTNHIFSRHILIISLQNTAQPLSKR
jgi:aldehyde:ferredoxin oxidoreductase